MRYIAYLPTFGNFSQDIEVAKKAAWGVGAEAVELEAESIDEVFAKLNHGSGQELEGYTGRSLSIGDVVVSDGGEAFMCASTGWKNLRD